MKAFEKDNKRNKQGWGEYSKTENIYSSSMKGSNKGFAASVVFTLFACYFFSNSEHLVFLTMFPATLGAGVPSETN